MIIKMIFLEDETDDSNESVEAESDEEVDEEADGEEGKYIRLC